MYDFASPEDFLTSEFYCINTVKCDAVARAHKISWRTAQDTLMTNSASVSACSATHSIAEEKKCSLHFAVYAIESQKERGSMCVCVCRRGVGVEVGVKQKPDILFSVKNQNKNYLNNSTHDAEKSNIYIYIYAYICMQTEDRVVDPHGQRMNKSKFTYSA